MNLLLCLFLLSSCGEADNPEYFKSENTFIEESTTKDISNSTEIIGTTDTANWVIVNDNRINLFDYKIATLSNYVTWQEVEPEEGNFQWSGLDRLLNEASTSNKQLAYHIIPGTHAPDWAYSVSGNSPYTYTFNSRKVKTYLPWIEQKGNRYLNTEMLRVWEKTIKNFSNHIHEHPKKDLIKYIAITGGPTSNGLEIMWAQDNYEEFKNLKWDQEAEGYFVEYWKRIIDIYIEAFPDMPLGLALTDYFGVDESNNPIRNYEIPKEIIDYALQQALEKKRTVIPMGLWIGAIEITNINTHPLVELLLGFNTPYALQGAMDTDTYEHLSGIINFAQTNNASWLELWHHDVINPDYCDFFCDTNITP